MLAAASNAIIIGFNVRPDDVGARDSAAAQTASTCALYRVIYECIEEIEAAMKGMLAPKFREKVTRPRVEVRQVFNVSGVGTIAGCYVHRRARSAAARHVRVLRDGVVIFEGKLASLKRFKDDVQRGERGL